MLSKFTSSRKFRVKLYIPQYDAWYTSVHIYMYIRSLQESRNIMIVQVNTMQGNFSHSFIVKTTYKIANLNSVPKIIFYKCQTNPKMLSQPNNDRNCNLCYIILPLSAQIDFSIRQLPKKIGNCLMPDHNFRLCLNS